MGNAGRRLKDFIFRLCRWLWRRRPRPASELAGSAPRRLLVVQLQYVGDSLMATPLVRALRRGFPSAQIDLVVNRVSRAVYDENLDIHERLVLEQWTRGGFVRWFEVLAALPSLRRGRYDWILCDASETAFSYGLFAWLTGIPVRLGFAHHDRDFLFTHTLPFPTPGSLESMAKINLRYGHALGIPAVVPAPIFAIPPETRRRVADRLENNAGEAPHPLVVIHPGSKFPANNWMPERFTTITQWLCEVYHATVVFVGAPHEVRPFQWLFGRSGSILNWSGRTSLAELAALFERADTVIVLDSGPAHLAAAVRAKTVVLRSARAPRALWMHAQPNIIDLWRSVPCAPCEALRCQNRNHPQWCMELITVSDVQQAIRRFVPAP